MKSINLVPRGYLSSETSIHFMNYHFVWCPKYRRKVLVGKVEARLKALLEEKTKSLGCKIIAFETMPDHVHLFVQATPTIAPNRIFAALKSYTSRELRKEFPELKTRLLTLWSCSYFVSTHGHVSSDTIKQ
jgi:putative transposase